MPTNGRVTLDRREASDSLPFFELVRFGSIATSLSLDDRGPPSSFCRVCADNQGRRKVYPCCRKAAFAATGMLTVPQDLVRGVTNLDGGGKRVDNLKEIKLSCILCLLTCCFDTWMITMPQMSVVMCMPVAMYAKIGVATILGVCLSRIMAAKSGIVVDDFSLLRISMLTIKGPGHDIMIKFFISL